MWTLYCPNGRIISFYVEGCAKLYRNMWGGTLVYEAEKAEFKDIEPPLHPQKLVA
jgi:hypothetical protein